jgi:hypothetical protein
VVQFSVFVNSTKVKASLLRRGSGRADEIIHELIAELSRVARKLSEKSTELDETAARLFAAAASGITQASRSRRTEKL